MDLHEIVMKLVGPIDPVGETYADDRSFENLKQLISLMDELIDDINRVSINKGRPEFSVNRAGWTASKFLTDRIAE